MSARGWRGQPRAQPASGGPGSAQLLGAAFRPAGPMPWPSRSICVGVWGGLCIHTVTQRPEGNGGGGGPGSARAPRQGALPGRLVRGAPSQGPQDPDALPVSGASEVQQMWTTERGGHVKLPWRAKGQDCRWWSLQAGDSGISPGQGTRPSILAKGPAHLVQTATVLWLGDPVGRAGGRTGERRPPKAPELDMRAPSIRLGWNPRGWCPPSVSTGVRVPWEPPKQADSWASDSGSGGLGGPRVCTFGVWSCVYFPSHFSGS